jgi:hypothetical protein
VLSVGSTWRRYKPCFSAISNGSALDGKSWTLDISELKSESDRSLTSKIEPKDFYLWRMIPHSIWSTTVYARSARYPPPSRRAIIPARLKVDLSGAPQNRTAGDSGRRRESGFMSAGISGCAATFGVCNATPFLARVPSQRSLTSTFLDGVADASMRVPRP